MEATVELTLMALSKSKVAENSFVMVLEDEEGAYRLTVVIGASEAQYIGIVLEKLQTKRPLTHDLLLATLHTLGGRLAHVLLHSIVNGVFLAELHIVDEKGETHTIDARPSDAVALALAQRVRILTYPSLLRDAASQADLYAPESSKTSYSDYTVAELEELLQRVLEKEDYESAARIRESINKKRNKI